MQLMTQWVKGISNDDKPFTNVLCKVGIIFKSRFNGAHCSTHEMQKKQDSGTENIKIRPVTNEDGWQHQIAGRINVSPINNIGMRHVELCLMHNKLVDIV